MSSLLPTQIIAIIWICINDLVLVPYVGYQIYIFYRNRHCPFISRRKPMMVLPFCVCCLFTVAVVMPICFGFEIFHGKQNGDNISEKVAYFCVIYFIVIIVVIGVWRAWYHYPSIIYQMTWRRSWIILSVCHPILFWDHRHILFDIRHQMEASGMTLHAHLENDSLHSHWFTNSVHTFGNSGWTAVRLFIFVLIVTVATMYVETLCKDVDRHCVYPTLRVSCSQSILVRRGRAFWSDSGYFGWSNFDIFCCAVHHRMEYEQSKRRNHAAVRADLYVLSRHTICTHLLQHLSWRYVCHLCRSQKTGCYFNLSLIQRMISPEQMIVKSRRLATTHCTWFCHPQWCTVWCWFKPNGYATDFALSVCYIRVRIRFGLQCFHSTV